MGAPSKPIYPPVMPSNPIMVTIIMEPCVARGGGFHGSTPTLKLKRKVWTFCLTLGVECTSFYFHQRCSSEMIRSLRLLFLLICRHTTFSRVSRPSCVKLSKWKSLWSQAIVSCLLLILECIPSYLKAPTFNHPPSPSTLTHTHSPPCLSIHTAM